MSELMSSDLLTKLVQVVRDYNALILGAVALALAVMLVRMLLGGERTRSAKKKRKTSHETDNHKKKRME